MRLCELNVLSQAINVAETTLLQDAWSRGQPVAIHSLIYGLDNGILHQVGPSLEAPAGGRAAQARARLVEDQRYVMSCRRPSWSRCGRPLNIDSEILSAL